MFDYNTTTYGLYLFSDDMIGKLSLFGGLSLIEIQRFRCFFTFDYKNLNADILF